MQLIINSDELAGIRRFRVFDKDTGKLLWVFATDDMSPEAKKRIEEACIFASKVYDIGYKAGRKDAFMQLVAKMEVVMARNEKEGKA